MEETLLPCSPSAMMKTDIAQKILQESHAHEEALAAKAPSIVCVCGGYAWALWVTNAHKLGNQKSSLHLLASLRFVCV